MSGLKLVVGNEEKLALLVDPADNVAIAHMEFK